MWDTLDIRAVDFSSVEFGDVGEPEPFGTFLAIQKIFQEFLLNDLGRVLISNFGWPVLAAQPRSETVCTLCSNALSRKVNKNLTIALEEIHASVCVNNGLVVAPDSGSSVPASILIANFRQYSR
jgi:hypothetical protein